MRASTETASRPIDGRVWDEEGKMGGSGHPRARGARIRRGMPPGTLRGLGLMLALAVTQLLGSAGSAAAADCPNEALRLGASAQLPECRAYEMVTPVDKNGGFVHTKVSAHATASGGAISFFSGTAFAGDQSNPQLSSYVSRRGATNWTTAGIDAPQLNPGATIQVTTPYGSPDLSKSLQVSKKALTPGAVEGGSNFYIQNNLTGERELIVGLEDNTAFLNAATLGTGILYGASADWSHLLLHNASAMLEGGGSEDLYEFSDGRLRFASVLPDGSVATTAHIFPLFMPYPHPMSEDGSRIFFSPGPAGIPAPLYMREDGAVTVPISASQRAEDMGHVENAEFGVANADGSLVYFISGGGLTEDTETGSRTLYRYDVETGKLTDLTAGALSANGPEVKAVLAASEDGSYVYFIAGGVLTPDAEEGQATIYAWHEGEIKRVGQTSPLELETYGPVRRLASPDGRYFAFGSYSPMTPDDVPGPPAVCPGDGTTHAKTAGDCMDVYLYDYATGTLRCVSCNGSPRGESALGGAIGHEMALGNEYEHSVLDNGTVYFQTPNRLLERDVNGVQDVYAWQNGTTSLISTGRSEVPSWFAEATPDGSDVFLTTNQQLVGQDVDASADLYDAKVDGGLIAQWPPTPPAPCEGDGCRGATAATPGAAPAASVLPSTGGNLPARCAKLAGRADRAERAGRRLSRKAKAAHGRKAHRRLQRKAHRQRRQARRLHAQAGNCGGQG